MRARLVLVALVAGCGFNQTTKPDPANIPAATGGVLGGEAISAANAPPPLSGGTLLVSSVTANTAYTSDPDQGTVDVVQWTQPSQYSQSASGKRVWTADVGAGSEPGRIVEDAAGLVYVVLRQKGQIATLDVPNRTVTLRGVCPAPRGIDASGSSVLVACAGGELMSLPFGSGGDATLVQQLDGDLRDVVSMGGSLYVSRFRSAELLTVANGAMTGTATPWLAQDHVPDPAKPGTGTIKEYAHYQPEVAWRTVAAPDGALYAVHLYATTRTVPTVRSPSLPVPYYGGAGGGVTDPCFGGGGVVLTAVTRYQEGRPTGTVVLPFTASAIDVAVSPTTGEVAIATPTLAGKLGSSSPTGGVSSGTSSFTHNVILVAASTFDSEVPTCLNAPNRVSIPSGQPVAVAFTRNGNLLVQTREPSQLVSPSTYNYNYGGTGGGMGTNALLALPVVLSETVHDTGFTMFHEATGSAIACMSCHPEGGDDGHTWHFDLGYRRTQSIRGGILPTAPFHWSGDEPNISALSHDVFSERMGGAIMTEAQTAVLGSWVDRIPVIPSRSTLDVAAVTRGQSVFAKADCGSCHSGEHFTSNENKDVGTGAKFQVPSLRGVAARSPYMHDGCAPTLMARFTDTKCGGTDHGKTVGLTAAELSDLVSYVESL